MVNSRGLRRGTRYLFSKPFRKHGISPLTSLLRVYKRGDLVDIKANATYTKGMPHKFYHGKTGRIFNVTPHGVGILVNKRVRYRVMEKRINVRVEHIKPSRCREDFVRRLKLCGELRNKAKERGVKISLKRKPKGPRRGHWVTTRGNKPKVLRVVPFENVL